MKKVALAASLLLALSSQVQAQDKVYRCGNEYTNNPQQAKDRGCKLVEGAQVTVIPTVKSTTGNTKNATSPATGSSIDNTQQRQRDADARAILEAELKKLQDEQLALQKEYNNGEPDKQGSEARNYQKYLDRVETLKLKLARVDADIAALKRELSRLPPAL